MYAGQWRRHPVAIKVVAQSAPLDGSLLAEFHREVPPPRAPRPRPRPGSHGSGGSGTPQPACQRQAPSEADSFRGSWKHRDARTLVTGQ